MDNLFNRKDISYDLNLLINNCRNKLITTSCGFFYYLQNKLSKTINDKIFVSSSLIQIPLLLDIIPSQKKIGILTANSNKLDINLLCNIYNIDKTRLVIQGMENKDEFKECILKSNRYNINLDKMRQEILENVENMLNKNSSIFMLVIECTDIDYCVNDIRTKFKIPVYNLISLINMLYYGL